MRRGAKRAGRRLWRVWLSVSNRRTNPWQARIRCCLSLRRRKASPLRSRKQKPLPILCLFPTRIRMFRPPPERKSWTMNSRICLRPSRFPKQPPRKNGKRWKLPLPPSLKTRSAICSGMFLLLRRRRLTQTPRSRLNCRRLRLCLPKRKARL